MGLKDSKAKEYFADNERFADLCNYVIYNGEKVVKPEQLKEQDPSEVLSVYGVAKKWYFSAGGIYLKVYVLNTQEKSISFWWE